MNNDALILLIRTLGDQDGLWLPQRDWSKPQAAANRYFLRQHWRETGLPWRTGSSIAGRRVQISRQLEDAQGQGLVEVNRGSGKFPRVKLTDIGEALARRTLGQVGIDSALYFIQELLLERSSNSTDWTSEYVPGLDCEGGGVINGKRLGGIEQLSLPALARGWVEASSDVRGHVRYRVTEDGLRVIDTLEITEADLGEVQTDPELEDVYVHAVHGMLTRLQEEPPEDSRQLGAIPLPVSMPWNGKDPWTCEAAQVAVRTGRPNNTATVRN